MESKTLKTILALLMAAVMVLAMAACGNSGKEEAPAEPAEEEAQPEEQTQEEAPAEGATAAAPETAEAVTTAQGYDAYSDPSANIVARFETDENGE